MSTQRDVPSQDDTMKVVKQIRELTDEMQLVSEQLSELLRKESETRMGASRSARRSSEGVNGGSSSTR